MPDPIPSAEVKVEEKKKPGETEAPNAETTKYWSTCLRHTEKDKDTDAPVLRWKKGVTKVGSSCVGTTVYTEFDAKTSCVL